jgi:hypothetical protein
MVRKALIKTRVHRVRRCLVHPRVGDMGDYVAQLCSGVWCQVSATEFDPLRRSRSSNGLYFTGVGLQLHPNQCSG